MANLTANIDREEKEGKLLASPLAASELVFNGSLVKHNAAGYLAKCAAEVGASFAGVCYEKVTNTAVAGEKSARVMKEGAFVMDGTGFTQADIGAEVFAQDDNLVSKTDAGNQQAVGKIVQYISATQVRVKIDGYAV